MDDRRPQIIAAGLLHETIATAILGRHFGHTVGLTTFVDLCIHRFGRTCRCERGKWRLRVGGRERSHRAETLSQCVGDLACVTTRPDAARVDTASATVQEDAIDHQIEIVFPTIDYVIAQHDLREARTVNGDSRISGVLIDSGLTTEDHCTLAVGHDRSANIVATGIDRDRLARQTRLEEGFGDAVRRPELLRSGFDAQANLHR